MYSIKTASGADYLYEGTKRVKWAKSPHKWNGWKSKPKFLIIHYTAAGGYTGSVNWFANPNSKVSAHLTIGRDGTIVQSVPFDDRAWHAGTSSWIGDDGTKYKSLNHHSIGIELANAGICRPTAAGTWKNALGVKVAPEDIMEARHKNGAAWFNKAVGSIVEPGWETYPTEQIFACLQVAIALVDHYGLEDVLGHDDISPGRKWDPGPLFNMDQFRNSVFGRGGADEIAWVVRESATDGLAVREGAGKSHAKVMDNIPPGTRVEFNESDGRWWFVTVLDENENEVGDGWVYSKYLKRVRMPASE